MKNFKELDQMLADLEKERKEHPVKTFFEDIYYAFLRFCGKPKNIYREIKWFIQRGKRGFADCDVWGFDCYLSKVISEGCKNLKENKMGIPYGLSKSDTDEDFQKGIEQWDAILDKIIKTFKTDSITLYKMSPEEKKEYREGWKLFQKYF